MQNKIQEQITELASLLKKNNAVLIAAESCTGGWLAKFCTDVSGSSEWFEGGVVSYSNHLKQTLLNVSSQTLEEYGAVSEQTAQAMATGVVQLTSRIKNTIGISITGIAGPGGGSVEKPVGTVCFGWTFGSRLDGVTSSTKNYIGDRNSVRLQSVSYALDGLIKLLNDPAQD